MFSYDHRDTVLSQTTYNNLVNKDESTKIRMMASHNDHLGNVIPAIERLKMATIESFHDLHSTFFESRHILEYDTSSYTLLEYYDMTAPAGYYTDALFRNAPFKDIFTRNDDVRPIRSKMGHWLSYRPFDGYREIGNPANRLQLVPNQVYAQNRFFTPSNTQIVWADSGPIIGTKDNPEKIAGNNITKTNYVKHNLKGSRDNTDLESSDDIMFKMYGGGVLGSIPYILKNIPQIDDRRNGEREMTLFDGGRRMPRLWAQHLISDFFCRELPVLRADDYKNSFFTDFYTDNGQPNGNKIKWIDINSDFAWQKSSGCMQCHGTLDPLVGVMRHVAYGEVHNSIAYHDGNRSPRFYAHAQEINQHFIHPTSISHNYKNHKRTGYFFFRDFRGDPQRMFLNSLQDFGTKIGQLDDPYKCAIKRYYAYFTGNDIPIFDKGSGAYQLDSKAADHDQFIESLIPAFKSNQRLKDMIGAIITSPQFKKVGYEIGN